MLELIESQISDALQARVSTRHEALLLLIRAEADVIEDFQNLIDCEMSATAHERSGDAAEYLRIIANLLKEEFNSYQTHS